MNSYEINTILVPIDFSPVSRNALTTAIAMCKRQFATLTLLYVVENSYLHFIAEAGAAAAPLHSELIEIANTNLTSLAKEIREEHDVVVSHIVQSGKPSDQIFHWATTHAVDLIVMGSTNKSSLFLRAIGSTALSVVRHAPCPVLTIPGVDKVTDFKKILFPIRVTPGAIEKYETLQPILRKNNSSLLLAGIVKKADQGTLVEMKDLVDVMRDRIRKDNIDCAAEVHYCEDVADQVLQISAEENPDLVVITASLDSSWRELFPGTYTERIVSQTCHPVLSIRPAIQDNRSDRLSFGSTLKKAIRDMAP